MSSNSSGNFSDVLFVILLFLHADVVSITVYDRYTPFNIVSFVAQCKPDFEFLKAGALFTDTASEPFVWAARSRPRKRHRKGEREPESLSDSDTVPSDLLSQPFCWLTFSHWTTNSANCGRASHTNEKQGTAALFASQKHGCLQWFQTQPSSLRVRRVPLGQNKRAHREKQRWGQLFSLSTTRGVMKGIYTLLNPSAPLIWNFICFCVDHSGYGGNLQRS